MSSAVLDCPEAGLPRSLEELQEKLGYRFADSSLLRDALTFRSAKAESGNGDRGHTASHIRGRMELVGDCALGLALYTQMWEATEKPGFKEAFPDFSGKHIDAARQRVLSNRNLMAIAARLNLGDYFIIEGYPPVHAENIRRGCKTGADVLEAVCAAIYLDAKDIAPVKAFLERYVEDNKTALYQPPARGRE